MPHDMNPLYCKILSTPGEPSDPPQPGASKGIPGDTNASRKSSGDKKTKEMGWGNLPVCFKGK